MPQKCTLSRFVSVLYNFLIDLNTNFIHLSHAVMFFVKKNQNFQSVETEKKRDTDETRMVGNIKKVFSKQMKQ